MPTLPFEDLSLFFGEFAVTGVFTPSGGSPVAVTGIMDEDFSLVEALSNSVGVMDNKPMFTVPSSTIVDAGNGATLTLDAGGVYLVREVHADGTGLSVLVLEQVS